MAVTDWRSYADAMRDSLRHDRKRIVDAQNALWECEQRLRRDGSDELAEQFADAIGYVEELAGAFRAVTYDAHNLLREYECAASAMEDAGVEVS